MSKFNTAPLDEADPKEMPYYLLLVGSPEEIPYIFQYSLDVNRAVGRIYFDTVAEYANYAMSVVSAETGKDGPRLPRQATFWGATNENDGATKLSTEFLVKPLCENLSGEFGKKWTLNSYLGAEASRTQLQSILEGKDSGTPALLLTASHGIGFNLDDNRLIPHQGALIGSDWVRQPGRITEDKYLAGEHISSSANLHGLVAFFFACYGAGTPTNDDFMGKVEGTAKQIAPRPLIAKLPQRMLSHPKGGALAVIGHVDRAWTFSFMEDSRINKSSLLSFESTLTELFTGMPIGHALEYFNRKHASTSVSLVRLLDEKRRGEEVDDYQLIDTWVSNHDSRNYIILGDPAVRLCVNLENEEIIESSLELQDINLDLYQVSSNNHSDAQSIVEETVTTQKQRSQAEQKNEDDTGEDFLPIPTGKIQSPKALNSMTIGLRYDWTEYINHRNRYVANWAVEDELGQRHLITIEANNETKELRNNINLRTGKRVNLENLESGSFSLSLETNKANEKAYGGSDFPINLPSKEIQSPKAVEDMAIGIRYDWIDNENRYVANWVVEDELGRRHLVTIEVDEETKELRNNINLRTGQRVNLRNIRGGSFGVSSAQDMGLLDGNFGESIQIALDNFSEQISRALRNISTLEVLTYMSDDDLGNIYDADAKSFREEARLKAVTLLSLDGDVKTMVPSRQVEVISGEKKTFSEEIDTEVLEFHKDMVALAQENQARFFKNVLEIAATLVNMGK